VASAGRAATSTQDLRAPPNCGRGITTIRRDDQDREGQVIGLQRPAQSAILVDDHGSGVDRGDRLLPRECDDVEIQFSAKETAVHSPRRRFDFGCSPLSYTSFSFVLRTRYRVPFGEVNSVSATTDASFGSPARLLRTSACRLVGSRLAPRVISFSGGHCGSKTIFDTG